LTKTLGGFAYEWNRFGEQLAFFVKTIGGMREAIGRYRVETMRAVAELAMGVGMLALTGGAVMLIFTVLGNIGILIGMLGQANLDRVGVSALAGVFAAYIGTRLALPLIVAVGLAATVGAGTTARIGAMRINEEIDALEVIGIRTIPYVASTRVLAGLIVTLPLICVGDIASYLGSQFVFTTIYENSAGGYQHYFHTYVNPTDTFWTIVQVMLQSFTIMLVHTYYGYNATGGPPGVGEATGRAVRASLVAAMFVTALSGLALYGKSGSIHLSA
jgi:phospholipid/cholesterol/gamma-HCH transport system permease protein